MITNSIIKAIDDIGLENGAQAFIKTYEEQHGFVPESELPMSEIRAATEGDLDRMSHYELIAYYKRLELEEIRRKVGNARADLASSGGKLSFGAPQDIGGS